MLLAVVQLVFPTFGWYVHATVAVDCKQLVHHVDHAFALYVPHAQFTHRFTFVFVLYAVDDDHLDVPAAQF